LDDGPERAEATAKALELATEEAAAVEVIVTLDDDAIEEAAADMEIVPLDDVAVEEAAAVEVIVSLVDVAMEEAAAVEVIVSHDDVRWRKLLLSRCLCLWTCILLKGAGLKVEGRGLCELLR